MDGSVISIVRPPRWAPVRYQGFSPRPTALRIVGGMRAASLRRLGGCHPLTMSLTSIDCRWEAVVRHLRDLAEDARCGRTIWSPATADRLLVKLRHMRTAHTAAVRLARQMAERAR